MNTQPAGEGNDAIAPCPHFGVCGGCQLQHLAYSAQLGQKAVKLRELLSGFTLPELQLHASQPLGYRNRIRLTLAQAEGQLRAGYLGDPEEPDAPGRDLKFVPIAQCPIAAPLLWRTAEAFVALAEGAAWLRQPQIVPDQLELFTTADESRLLFTLYLRVAQKTPPARLTAEFAGFCEQLRAQVPELAGAGIAYLPAATRSRRTEQQRPGPAWGAPGLNYAIALPGEDRQSSQAQPLAYWVPRGAFFQVNRLLLPELVALVSRVAAAVGAHDRTLAWDLYAGVGLFSRVLAGNFGQVSAVELAEPAATALAQMKVPGLRAAKATTLDFLRTAVVQRERPSLVVVDPPRMGLGAETCSLLARVAAPGLVYVSCSPKALAADSAVLIASGYTVRELHLFDLFPQTEHVETVAMLQRP